MLILISQVGGAAAVVAGNHPGPCGSQLSNLALITTVYIIYDESSLVRKGKRSPPITRVVF